MADAKGEAFLLGDIVERWTEGCVDVVPTTTTVSSQSKETAVGTRSFMRPVQAVVGRSFPLPLSDHFYGHYTHAAPHQQGDSAAAAAAAASAVGCTAHMQPTLDGGSDITGLNLKEGTGAIASMACQHQWEPKEFDDLERGYYVVPPHSSACMEVLEETQTSTVVPRGEEYIDLLLRFLRSTVRKHRELATEALRTRLSVDAKLRERCAFGLGCAQLVHLIIMQLASGHAVPCSASAECLALLFYDATAEVVEAAGEISTPPTDHDACALEMGGQGGNKDNVSDDTTFAELSQLMRSGEERSRTLEKLGLTTAVMDALELLLPPALAAQVLLGGGVLSLPHTAIRVASDPRYARFVTERLASVVLGTTPLDGVAEELLLLRRVLHLRQACAALLPQLHETLVLFFRYVCDAEMRSMRDVVACLAASLVLRELVRHGYLGPFYDVSDALLSSGGVGAYVPAEMHLLLVAANTHSKHSTPAAAATTTISSELARGSFQAVATHIYAVEKCVVDETSAGNCLALLAALSSMHYLATYFMASVGWEEVQLLLGSPRETRCGVQKLLAQSVLTLEGLQRAFSRLSGGQGAGILPSTATVTRLSTALHPAAFVEACWASLTHARARLAAAACVIFAAEHWEAPLRYVADMAIRFEEKCMGLLNVTGCLFPDELCTMIEIVHLMRREVHSVANDGVDDRDDSGARQQQQRRQWRYARETRIAELFVLHSIALTKHGLDAAPRLIHSILGLSDDIELGAVGCNTSTTITGNRTLTPCALVELGRSLQRAVAQMQWPWFLFPLYDDELTSKSAWCVWVLQSLGVHEHMKNILQWDAILCHALKWAVSHRETQQDWGGIDDSVTTPCSGGSELFHLLGELCGGVLPRAGGVTSHSASDTMKTLAACGVPHAEETMERYLFEALAVTATACEPSTAVSVVRLLSHTILQDDGSQSDRWPASASAVSANVTAVADCCNGGVVEPVVVSGEGLLGRWASTGLLGDDVASRCAVPWDLENFSELLRVVMPQHEVFSGSDGNEGIMVLQRLVEGFTRMYLRQHQPLTTFERHVLSRTIKEVSWCPACLRAVLEDSREQLGR